MKPVQTNYVDMKEVQTNDVIDRLQSLTVKDEEVEQEFHKDFGSRLRLVEGARTIQETGNQLNCCIVTIARAQSLFHRFQRLERNSQLHYVVVAAACLNLSIKLSQEDISINQVLLKFYHVAEDLHGVPNPLRPDPPLERFNIMIEYLEKAEYSVCKVMSFKLESRVAHTHLSRVLEQLRDLPGVNEAILVATSSTIAKLLSTYYLCEGCVDYDAYEIAVACLQFAFLHCGILVPSFKRLMERELSSVENKERISDILDELIVVSDVATTLNYI